MSPGLPRKRFLFQSAVLMTMLALAPVAMRLRPFESPFFHPQSVPYGNDPLFLFRSALVGFGLTAALLFLFALLPPLVRVQARLVNEGWRAAQRTPDFASFLVQCAMTLCAIALGWRAFPYWACGAYQSLIGKAPWVIFDPRYLPPMTWIGEVWRIGAVAVSPLVLTASLILLPLAAVMARRHRRIWPEALVIVVVLLTLLSFLYTPSYREWLYGSRR